MRSITGRPTNSTPEPVLVLEDTPHVRALNAHIVREEGYPVYEAETLIEARAIVRRYRPWLLMLDVDLPDGLCWELLDWVDRRRGDSPAAMIVTSNGRYAREFCPHYAARVCSVLDKGVDTSEYLYHLRRGIRKCRIAWERHACPNL